MIDRAVRICKFLSLVLRHRPEKIGLRLNQSGWTSVEQLIESSREHGVEFTLEELQNVVASSDKKRFSLSEDGLWIRANQGHSIKVELGYVPTVPPEILYHGTAERFLTSIKQRGLIKGRRHHVHLSVDVDVAAKVGQRHGSPVVLRVKAGLMHRDSFIFYLMTSMHMLIGGQMHAWHFDRLADEQKHLIIKPTLDRALAIGEASTTSDDKDNVHWFKATSDVAFTFNIGVYEIDRAVTFSGRQFYLDPAGGEKLGDGSLRVRHLNSQEAHRLYGKS